MIRSSWSIRIQRRAQRQWGCCASKGGRSAANRAGRWRSTGIVGLRGCRLKLLVLNASNNRLKSLPESIGSCLALEEVQANGNPIEYLPSSICNLKNLKSLSLTDNHLRQTEGFQEFEAWRKKKFDKQIDSNVMICFGDLHEGVRFVIRL